MPFSTRPSFPIQQNLPLSSLTTLGIGGPARYFTKCNSIAMMQKQLQFCYTEALPFIVIGKGSNCLFDDRGFNGFVILNDIKNFVHQGARFSAGSGFSFARLGKYASRNGWQGLEFASGIPASVGGAIFMNAGAGNQETKDKLVEVLFVTEEGDLKKYKKEDLEFGYRFSSFQTLKGAIVQGDFLLEHSDGKIGEYKQHLSYRLKTQPYKEKSAGCAFRNPHLFSAGRLIEESGLKGKRRGGARVSTVHANFLINEGNATCRDILNLIQEIKETVYHQKGVYLEEEIRYIPYDGNL